MKNKNITILWGLPGSGKTTYANNNFPKESIVDLDYINFYKTDNIASAVLKILEKYDQVVIDGLIYSNKFCSEILKLLNQEITKYNLHYNLIWFKLNREFCLLNDAKRVAEGKRKLLSDITIKSAKFEEPDIKLLSEFKGVCSMEIVNASDPIVGWLTKLGVDNKSIKDLKIKSGCWSLGGSYGNCYGDTGSVDAETPLEFEAFDDLLLKINPEISFLIYNNIYNKCCSIETKDESDFYGGSVEYAYHVCDLAKLYTVLIKLKLI